MNGQNIPLVRIWSTGADVLYAADITDWAGAKADLRIGIKDNFPIDPIGLAVLDSIEFSPLPVPEPGVAITLAVPLLMLRRRRR